MADSVIETRKRTLPTHPGRVVWCQGHVYVREDARWVGVDDRGRARSLTDADLRRHGWSLTRNKL